MFPTQEKPTARNNKAAMVAVLLFFVLAVVIGLSQRTSEGLADVPKASEQVKKEMLPPPPTEAPAASPATPEAPKPEAVTHYLMVTSDPPNAAVRYGGKDLGRAPLKIAVTPSLFPFSVEAYLPERGLLKTDCFAKPEDAKTEYPCVLRFPKKEKNALFLKQLQQKSHLKKSPKKGNAPNSK